MDWKEFFRPTLPKIVIFIVILIIFFLFPIVPILNQVRCIKAPCPPIEDIIAGYRIFNNWVIFTPYTYLVLFIEILVSYLISSFIVLIIKKIKSKK